MYLTLAHVGTHMCHPGILEKIELFSCIESITTDHMPGGRTSAGIHYTDAHSAQGKALIDIAISQSFDIVGSNSPALASVNKGSFVVVHSPGCWCLGNSHEARCRHRKRVLDKQVFCIGEIVEEVTHEYVVGSWKREGGLRWKYNFKVKWLTPIIRLSTYVKITIQEICSNVGVNYRDFFHPIKHNSDFRRVVEKLLENIV